MLIQLALALLFFSLSRLLFYLFNLQYFGGIGAYELLRIFFGGLRFDISAVIILSAPFIFMNVIPFPFRTKKYWQIISRLIFYITIILGLALNAVDSVYFRFTSKRMTADIFSFVRAGEDDILSLAPSFLSDFFWEFVSWVLLSILFVWVSSRFGLRKSKPGLGIRYYLLNSLLFILTGIACIIGIRGGTQLRPFTIIDAGKYGSSKDVVLVLNTPFTIIKTFGHTSISEARYFEDEQIMTGIYTPIHTPVYGDSALMFKPHNVVLIIMESFGTEYIGALNGREGELSYTPYLDSIIRQGLAFPAYANGKQSMEALPAIVAALPSLTTRPYITSAYGGNRINSLASVLGNEGYSSAFFHGGRNGTMGFESFVDIAGYDKYYGKDEYGDDSDFDGHWGIYDEAFFTFFKNEMDDMAQPFFTTFFSLSSHHPYAVPEKYEGKFSKGSLDIHESIMYADYALGKFFKEAENSSWFRNTLFVITADHTSLSYHDDFQTETGIYAIPLVFYMPGKLEAAVKEDIAQQTDIMPSVLGFLNYEKPYLAFGNNLFDTTALRFSVNFLNGKYQLIKDDWALGFDGKNTTSLIGLDGKDDMMNLYPEETRKLENFLKAYIQQYNNRLIHNQLIISEDNE